MADEKVEPYRFGIKFERAVVATCCRSPRFWGSIGHLVDPEGLDAEPAKLLLRACAQIAAQHGHGPEAFLVVVQRLFSWVQDGKIPRTKAQEADAWLEDAELAGIPSEQSLIEELKPVIQHRVRHAAVIAAIHDHGQRGDLELARELLSKADRVGVQDTSLGTILGPDAFDEVEKLRTILRLPTGILELDGRLDGGLPRGNLGVLVGGPGSGKSMALSHFAARLMANGGHVAYATLELSVATVNGRLLANLTGVPISDIFGSGKEETKARLKRLGGQGKIYVKDFTAEATTVADLQDWVKGCAARAGRPVDLLVVDYADLLGVPGGKDIADHKKFAKIYQSLRDLAVHFECWVWTASQSRGREESDKIGKKKTVLDMKHLADSMGKARVCDLMVTLNYDDATKEMGFFLAKNRNGVAREMIGPLPTDFATGAVAPVDRQLDTSLRSRVDTWAAIDAEKRLA